VSDGCVDGPVPIALEGEEHQAMDEMAQAEAIGDIAAALRNAEQKLAPIPPVAANLPQRSIAHAYAVQEANTRAALAAGRRLTGRKIGLTSLAVQKQLGVDQPDYGMLYADMEIADGDTIPAGTLIQPKVEAEIAFVLGQALPMTDPTSSEVLDAIEWVVPALEIVDSRIADWKISIFDTIADNASSGRFVLGGPAQRIDGLDLRMAGMVLERNGDPTSFGAGLACLGHPLHAVRWLAKVMAQAGRPLEAGDIVLSGALGPMVTAAAGDRFTAHVNGLGSVSVRFG
jgi:2-keto-4-pentenoate hydratase